MSTFPLLPLKEVLDWLLEYDLDVSENDFLRPDPRRWRHIYSNIFEMLTKRPIDQAIQSMCGTVNFQVAHPELFEEGFAQLAFTMCMKRVLTTCGYECFNVEDVISPSKQRLIRMLSGVRNFSLHLTSRLDVFDQEKHCLEQSKERFDAVKNKNEDLKSRVAKMAESQVRRDTEKHQYQAEIEERQQKLIKLKKQEPVELKYLQEQRLALSEKEKEKESIKVRTSELQQEVEKLSAKIVQSPDRFKQEQERLHKRLVETKNEVSGKEHELTAENLRLEKTKGKKLAAEKAVKLSLEVLDIIDNEKKVDVEVQKLMERKTDLVEKSSQVYKTMEDLMEKTNVRKEQKRNILKQTDVNKQEKQIRLHEYKQLKEKESQKNKSIQSTVEDYENCASALDLEAMKFDQEVEASKQRWQKDFNTYLEKVTEIDTQKEETYTHCSTVLKRLL